MVITASNGRAATLDNGFVYTASIPAWSNTNSIQFDGASNYLYTNQQWPELGTSGGGVDGGYSASFWFKLDLASAPSTSWMFSLHNDGLPWNTRLGMSANPTTGTITVREEPGDASSTATWYAYNAITDSNWHHYIVTSPGDGGTVTLYIDGVAFVSGPGKALATSGLKNTRLWLGVWPFNTTQKTPGNVDEFALFDIELGSSQVTSIYNSGIPNDITTIGGLSLSHYWRMGDAIGDEDGANAIIRDQVGTWDLNEPVGSPAKDADLPAMSATSVAPYFGVTGGNTQITITGNNFINVSSVTIDNNAASIVSYTATSIIATTPGGTAGAKDVVITSSNNEHAVIAGAFVYAATIPAWSNTYSTGFDGVTDYIYANEQWPELGTSGGGVDGGYSASFWFKLDLASAPSTSWMFSLHNDGLPWNTRLGMSANPTTGTITVREEPGDASSTATWYAYNAITDSNWHHYIVTSPGDGGTVTLYIDGVAFVSGPGKALATSGLKNTRLWLGVWPFNTTQKTPGNVDEFALFDIELGSSQVTSIYNSGIPNDITTIGGLSLSHYWQMGDAIGDEGGADAIIRDQVGTWDIDAPVGAPTKATDTP